MGGQKFNERQATHIIINAVTESADATCQINEYNMLTLDSWNIKIFDSDNDEGDAQFPAPEYDEDEGNFSLATQIFTIGSIVNEICNIESPELKSTIDQMCSENPAARPTPEQLLSLPLTPLSAQDSIVLCIPEEDADQEQFEEDYHVIKRLGSGGDGEIFLIEDPESKKQFAMKVTKNEKFQQALHEAGLLRQIDHPNVIKTID